MENKKGKTVVNLIYGNSTFIKFNEGVCKKFGHDIAILLAIFVELEGYFETNPKFEVFMKKSKGHFYCMAKFVKNRNNMSPDRMARAVKKMEKEKLITTRKWAKNWKLYRINHERLLEVLTNISIDNLEMKKINSFDLNNQLDKVQSDFEELKALI